MTFTVPLAAAKALFPDYTFVRPLTPSAQKCAFQVQDSGGVDLCLKIIAPNTPADRLQREIRALLLVDHPNVVRFREYTLSVNKVGSKHYVIEEFIAGTDLAEPLSADAPWDHDRTTAFFAKLCDGLAELEKHSIVHRDLKPTNVRVNGAGEPVIIDLGLARHLSLSDLTRTSDGAAIGTPTYFAPEQFQGTKYDIDHRTDLFAVGVMIYEALIGKHPFYRNGMKDRADLQDAVCNGTHQSAPAFKALPKDWRTVLDRLLAKTKERRFDSAATTAQVLRKLTGGSP